MNTTEEKNIIESILNGRTDAFKIVFNTYIPKMRAVAKRYANTSFETDDILQEAFIKVYNNLNKYKFEGSFEGWIRKIVVNTAITYYQKQKKELEFKNIEFINDFELDHVTPNEEFDSADILSIINKLPNGYKIIFNLYAIDEYSHKEIAQMLNITESTSRTQYLKARKFLKNILETRQQNYKF